MRASTFPAELMRMQFVSQSLFNKVLGEVEADLSCNSIAANDVCSQCVAGNSRTLTFAFERRWSNATPAASREQIVRIEKKTRGGT